MQTVKQKAAFLSVISNLLLIMMKIIAGILSGAVSILSEAIHSTMDLLASCIAFFSVSYSGKPADKKHPYGHGKIENISGIIEGILIFIAAGLIITKAIKKIIQPEPLSETNIAMLVMFISAITNIIISSILYKVAKKEDSIALEADALHLKTDVYTSAGVGAGILLIKLTGLHILDPVIAILVAALIIKEAYHLCLKAFRSLLDEKLPDHEEEAISQVINKYSNEIINYHDLKTRKAGNQRYVELHIVVNPLMTVEESHAICDHIENELNEIMGNISVNIHIEPAYDIICDN